MKKQLKKTDIQDRLFTQIRDILPENHSLAHTVAEILSISVDAAYRRIRGAKILDLDEGVDLCRHFNISLDRLLRLETDRLKCFYSPLDLGNSRLYLKYMQSVCKDMEQLRSLPGGQIILSATDVPFYHFLPFRELTAFKLYAWHRSCGHTQESYEQFADNMVSGELIECYRQTVDHFRQVPSIEIWTQNTVDHTLRLLEYFHDTGHFSSPETTLQLCEQFLELTNTINQWTENGIKNPRTQTPFNLYLSDFFLEDSLILLKHDLAMQCILKLFTLNSLNITDQTFCRKTHQWLESLIRRSLLISSASERDRYLFFHEQRNKIKRLMDRISRD
ncbi:MAG: hypothetical protein LBJ23_06155 [Tannerella sp.]|jgi:hypothetical protein|nr:hypothetical protein [Tannerella sp.]